MQLMPINGMLDVTDTLIMVQTQKKERRRFYFSFGLTPCVAVIPVFATAAAESQWLVLLTQLSFSLGVIAALVGSTLVVLKGLVKLDHPFLEHHGDVVTGLGVTLMGLLLYFFPHS